LGMAQYYRDLWAKCSEMLAPLTDLVGKWDYSKLDKAFIGQESAYSCKLQELPTGTSQWSSSLCTNKGSTHNHKICVSEKQYPKEVFLLRNLLRNIPYQSTGVSQQRIPNWWVLLRNLLEADILLAVTESSSHGTAAKLPPISPEITGCYTSIKLLGKLYHSFSTIEPNFKLIISSFNQQVYSISTNT
jgi:hypothetical protein